MGTFVFSVSDPAVPCINECILHVIKPGSDKLWMARDSYLLPQLTQLWLMSLAGDPPKLSRADNRKQNRKSDCTCPARSSHGVERVAEPYALRHVSQLGAAGRQDGCMDGHQPSHMF